ncbi:MAG: ABC transporter ATP-binding protein [Roseburia sp.]|nr:ABC transporter ATP-binding protein [Roseburia sp.]
MCEYIIETKGLTKVWHGNAAVDGVSLHVPKGQIYGLLGRNGAGKTTAMKMLLGLIRPTDGSVCLFGRSGAALDRTQYHRIGSMIEAPAFYENLTAEENLRILARLRGRHRRDTIAHALAVVGLDREGKKPFRAYSLGMKQRLGLAAAIMHEPELLILDEPMNGLDPIGIRETRSRLLRLCRERGTTILISSHILNEMEQLADWIGVLHAGRLLEETSMRELYRQNRRYVELAVSDVNKAAMVLERAHGISDYEVIDKGRLRLYEQLDSRAQINAALVREGISVDGISLREGTLEDWFAGLIGGGGIG